MGHLTLVRHGQASFHAERYDALSPLGHRQARRLGDYWVSQGIVFDTVWVGPRLRHRETLAAVAEAYAESGLSWPLPQELPTLDEHDGLRVMRHVLGDVRTAAAGEMTDSHDIVRHFFLRYRQIMVDWATGQLNIPDVESWQTFRSRAASALASLCTMPGRTVAFTSGGLISAVVGELLALDHHRVIDLSTVVHNAALTEIRYRPGEYGLVSFNTTPHLDDQTLLTMV